MFLEIMRVDTVNQTRRMAQKRGMIMRKKRWMIAAVLCLMMAGMTSCGNDDTNNSVTSGATSAPEASATQGTMTDDPDRDTDNVIDDVEDGAKDVIDGAGDAVKDVGDGVGDAVKDAGNAVDNATDDVTGTGAGNSTNGSNSTNR